MNYSPYIRRIQVVVLHRIFVVYREYSVFSSI